MVSNRWQAPTYQLSTAGGLTKNAHTACETASILSLEMEQQLLRKAAKNVFMLVYICDVETIVSYFITNCTGEFFLE